MDQKHREDAEKMGLRDFSDPETSRRAREERDLVCNLTLAEALGVNSAINIFMVLMQNDPEYLATKFDIRPKNPDAMIESLSGISNSIMLEIYRKQREIYKDKDH